MGDAGLEERLRALLDKARDAGEEVDLITDLRKTGCADTQQRERTAGQTHGVHL